MSRLALLALLIIHGFYALKRIVSSLIPARKPKPLLARRRRIPKHLALILVSDAENHDVREENVAMEECVEQIVDWCKEIGLQRLSVYEPDGVLSRNSRYTSSICKADSPDLLEEAAFESPRGLLTPPPSDTDSTSRPRSPGTHFSSGPCAVTTVQIPYISRNEGPGSEKSARRRRQSNLFVSKPRQQNLTLHILSRESSKPAIAAVARSLAATKGPDKSKGTFHLPIGALNKLLEGKGGFPPPDLIIVHSLHPSTAPLELYGFPPWQIRLSEIYYAPRRPRIIRRQDSRSSMLSEVEFRRALDEYSGAEMRLGK